MPESWRETPVCYNPDDLNSLTHMNFQARRDLSGCIGIVPSKGVANNHGAQAG